MTNVKKNISYQTIYQILTTALPLITAPYLSRVLGASQQGVYSYTNSVVSYFSLFAMLGIVNHGTRAIASCGNNTIKRSEQFEAIFLIQIVTSCMAFTAYILYLLLFCRENRVIAAIQIMTIIACFFDINWLFFGMEQFRITVTRNLVVKIVCVIGILCFVKQSSDLWIYTIFMSGSLLASNIILIFLAPRYLSFTKIKKDIVIKNLKPALILFIPVFAMTVYHVMDKTMLGILSDYQNSGYYYNADKIINIPIGIISGISTVLFPRMVSVLKEKSEVKFQNMFAKCVEGIVLISIILAFGIAAIANEFVPWFFGKEYIACIILVQALAPVMVIKSISTVVRYQYLIPLGKDRIFIYSVLAGAIINVIANMIFIPNLGALGAVIGTLLAELIACIVQLAFISRDIKIWSLFNNLITYIFMGIIMFIIVRLNAHILNINIFFKCIIEILIGIVVFTVLSLGVWKIRKDKTIINELLTIKKRN